MLNPLWHSEERQEMSQLRATLFSRSLLSSQNLPGESVAAMVFIRVRCRPELTSPKQERKGPHSLTYYSESGTLP